MAAIAARIKKSRTEKDFTAQQLGEAMTAAGFHWDRFVVQNIEKGRRQNISVAELLALAYILEIAPVHLIVPIDDEKTPLLISPAGPAVRPDIARAWIRGTTAIGKVDVRRYASQVPAHEFGPVDGRLTDAQHDARIAERMEQEGARTIFERDDITGMTQIRVIGGKGNRDEEGTDGER